MLPSVSVCISACQSYLCLICISRISVLVYQCVSVLGMCGSVSQCVSVLAQESLLEMMGIGLIGVKCLGLMQIKKGIINY